MLKIGAATKEGIVKQVEQKIKSIFTIWCLGEVNSFATLEVKRQNNIYSIDQAEFINQIVNEYGFSENEISNMLLD